MRLQRLLVPALAALAVVAGCGSSSSSSSGGADPASAVPKGTVVYVDGSVRPDGEQGDNARTLLKKFLPSGTTLESLLDKSIKEDKDTHVDSYAKDIKPWLGEKLGIGVLDLTKGDDATFIGAVQITDKDKATDFLKKQGKAKGSYKGQDLYFDDDTWAAAGDDLIVFAESKANLEKGIATESASSLADTKVFKDAIAKLPAQRLGSAYIDLQGAKGLIAGDTTLEPQEKAIFDKLLGNADLPPVTAALTAKPDSATVETRFGGEALARLTSLGLLGGQSTDLVKDVPADAFAVYGMADVGPTLKNTINTFAGAFGGAAITAGLESQTGINLQRDVFSWVGDVSVYARGTSMADLNGALTISVTDKAAAKAAIPHIVAAARKSGAPVQGADVKGADQAFQVPAPGAPGPVVLAQGGDRVVLAFGESAAAEALSPSGDTLGDSGRYDDAKSAIDGIEPSLLVSLSEVFALAEASGSTDADFEQAKPYLEKLDLAVTGTKKDGNDLRSLLTVTTK